jgi:SPP1 gp7 family putative phage head morphogenesis protein
MEDNLKIAKMPIEEAIEFFKAKAALPSGAYTDLIHEMHDKAFVIAGVTKAQFLSDVQNLLAEAQKQGTPFEQFYGLFKQNIDKQWGTGERPEIADKLSTGWRARTIYRTNMRTAKAAGIYKRLQVKKESYPYWRYRHGGSAEPREQHLRWDGLVLKADDPWWDTHFPPNGWGCSCFVEPVGKTEYEQTPDAKKVRPDTVTEKKRFGDRLIDVPVGIDPGWAYAPGAGGDQGLLRALGQGIPEISAQAWEEIRDTTLKRITADFQKTAQGIIRAVRNNQEPYNRHKSWVVGFIDSDLLQTLNGFGYVPPSAAIEVIDFGVKHANRKEHIEKKIILPEADYLRMPEIIADSKTTILRNKEDGSIVFAYNPHIIDHEKGEMAGVFVMQVGVDKKSVIRFKKIKRPLNRIPTAYLIPKKALEPPKHADTQSVYEIIRGLLW